MTFTGRFDNQTCLIACNRDKVEAGLCNCINRVSNRDVPSFQNLSSELSKSTENDDVPSISDLIGEMTSKAYEDLQERKTEIIIQRFKEITGEDLNLEEEKIRRFKRLTMEYQGNKETIYYNDGSVEGKRLVTFFAPQILSPSTEQDDSCQIISEIRYY